MENKKRKYKRSQLQIKRDEQIFQKIESGKTYAETAREYGVSLERIRQIYSIQGGDYRPKRAKHKVERAKQNELKYQSIFNIVKEHVQKLGYIPSYNELLEFMLKIEGSGYIAKVKKELFKTLKLPRKIDIRINAKREKMLQDLKRIYTIVQRPIGRKDLQFHGAMSYENYLYVFGSFKQACKKSGIPCPKWGGNKRKSLSGIRQVNTVEANKKINHASSLIL